MSVHGLCFDVGSSGNCCDNCYECSKKYGYEIMSDDEIIKIVGENEQKRMLYEYENN